MIRFDRASKRYPNAHEFVFVEIEIKQPDTL